METPPIPNQKERMLAGELYHANDPELVTDYHKAQSALLKLRSLGDHNQSEILSILKNILGHLGEGSVIRSGFFCDYGYNIRIGSNSFINYNCILLDVNPIIIGNFVKIGPSVQIYTASHPIDPALRRTAAEYGAPISIGDGAWIGGATVICPGITIGQNSVIGAGSVVTKSIPDNVVAAGNPCRILRRLS